MNGNKKNQKIYLKGYYFFIIYVLYNNIDKHFV